jgi:chromosome partitioning protein
MPKFILITHQKGGVGKSTIALNLAKNLSEFSKVAIIDADYQGSIIKLKSVISGMDILAFEDKKGWLDQLDHDFVIVDTPPYLSNYLLDFIAISDLIIVPTKIGIFDVIAMKQTIELVEKSGKKQNVLVVVNMLKPKTTLTQDIVKELQEYKVRIAKTMISDLVSFTRSPLFDGVDADTKAKTQLDSLTKEVLTYLI